MGGGFILTQCCWVVSNPRTLWIRNTVALTTTPLQDPDHPDVLRVPAAGSAHHLHLPGHHLRHHPLCRHQPLHPAHRRRVGRQTLSVQLSPDRMGPLGKPPASLALLPLQEPVAACTVALHSSLFTPMPVWSNISVVVHNLYCDRSSGQQETSGQNLKGLVKLIIIMIYTKHNH